MRPSISFSKSIKSTITKSLWYDSGKLNYSDITLNKNEWYKIYKITFKTVKSLPIIYVRCKTRKDEYNKRYYYNLFTIDLNKLPRNISYTFKDMLT